jgi:hypothetical protein
VDEDEKRGAACEVCRSKSDGEVMLLCDKKGCPAACHTYCCDVPLREVPPGPWHCHRCTCETKSNKGVRRVRRVHRTSPDGPEVIRGSKRSQTSRGPASGSRLVPQGAMPGR